jgi:Flp pilus assembly protein TadD
LYLATNQAPRAVAVLERAAAANDFSLLPLRAAAQAGNGNPGEARRLYRRAIANNPDDAGPRLGLIGLAVQAHDFAAARAAVQEALHALPGNASVMAASVDLERRAGGLPAALAEVAALRRDPRNLPASLGLEGNLRASQGDQAGAADAYLAAFHAAPAADLALAAASAMDASGRAPQAATLLAGWVASHPDDVAAMQKLGAMAMAAHRWADAAAWLDRVLHLRPNDVTALNNRAWVVLNQGDLAGARLLAQRAYFLSPEPELQDTLGWVLARQGDTAGALALLQPAAAAQPTPGVLFHLAYALHAARRDGEAKAYLDRALGQNAPFDERTDAEALRRQAGL